MGTEYTIYMSVPLEPSLYSFDSDGKGHHLTSNETSRLYVTHLVTMDTRERERERWRKQLSEILIKTVFKLCRMQEGGW